MKKLKITYLIIIIISLLICPSLFAEDEPEQSDTDSKIAETFGLMSFEFTLDDFGGGSLFEPTYYLPYNDQFVTLSNLDFFSRFSSGSFLDLSASHDFYTKSTGDIEFVDPGCWSVALENIENRFLNLPQLSEGKRRDSAIDIVLGTLKSNVTSISFDDRNMKFSGVGLNDFASLWNSRDFSVSHQFGFSGWDTQVGISREEVEYDSSDLADITSTSYSLSTEKEIDDNSLVRGDMVYNVSDVDSIGDVKNLQIGASGRFLNALGIDNLTMATKVRWLNRDDRVALLHPLGDVFNAALLTRYRPSKNTRFNFSWNMNQADKYRPDRNSIDYLIDNPDSGIIGKGSIIEDTVLTNTYRLGGEIDLTDNIDFRADWKLIRRNGLDGTDFFVENSSPLIWNSEDIKNYVLRYRPSEFAPLSNSDFELKWTTHLRKNSDRSAKDFEDHLTVNWDGFLTGNLAAHAGWGMFRTSSDVITAVMLEQKGVEYGAGFDWYFDESYLLYTDLWRYMVSGDDSYARTVYLVGFRYSQLDDWNFDLVYLLEDDEFDDFDYINGNLKTLRLTVSYDW